MNGWQRYTIGLVALVLLVALVSVSSLAGCRGKYNVTADPSDFVATGRTFSFFNPVQVDPRSEDSAGPQFVKAADLNGDGLLDLVSAWNQSQPVQVHLQSRSATGALSFETVTLAGNIPAVSVAGLDVADFDQDGNPDIAVLIKISLLADAGCLDSEVPDEGTLSGLVLLYMGPGDPTQANQALAWDELIVETSRLPAPDTVPTIPEVDGYTSMAVGDINLDGAPDIVLASNIACGGSAADVIIFENQGPTAVRDKTWQAIVMKNDFPKNTVKSVALGDIDGDGDTDIVATFPDAPSMNIRWFRNPIIDIADDYHYTTGDWQVGTVAQIATGADVLDLGDIDNDGILDVVVRSSGGGLIQWLKGPAGPTTAPMRNIPWQVYTIAEFTDRTPEAIALGDLNGDGQLELLATAEGGIAWFDALAAPSLYDQWVENLVIDDSPPDPNTDPATTDPNVTPTEVAGTTFINSLQVVDLDGDGSNDFIATLDRSGLSGITNDALIWFRNTN